MNRSDGPASISGSLFINEFHDTLTSRLQKEAILSQNHFDHYPLN
jgi:hypothetical protein